MGEAKTSPRRIRAAERHAEALKMRRAGMSYTAIAQDLGYSSKASAYNAVNRLLIDAARKTTEGAAELKTLEAERLDALQVALWSDAMGTGPDSTPESRAGAVRAIERLMARRAKLLGLDASDEDAARLVADQVAFMEGVLRSVLAGVQAMLLAHGLEEHVPVLMPVLEGEVVPRALTEVTAAAS